MKGHRGWHSRGYLPHYDAPYLVQAITFRLADSLPRAGRDGLVPHASPGQQRERFHARLDAGHGSCALRDPCVASLVERALLRYDDAWYRLLAWVIMPNHVHGLIEMSAGHSLSSIVRQGKGPTALQANRLLGRRGRFWQPDYHDRFVRDEAHLERAVRYVHNNPVMAGLVGAPQDWPFSSARHLPAIDATWRTPWER